jgi:hypothetical protein
MTRFARAFGKSAGDRLFFARVDLLQRAMQRA